MSRNLPLFEDVLSVEEHVLGCMCDSFSSDHEFEEMKKNSLRPLPMNRIDRVEDVHFIDYFIIYINEDLSSTYYVYVMEFMVSIGVNPITPFEMRRNSPLVAKSYPLSGGNKFIRSKKVMLLFLKKRTNRVSYPANFQN